MEKQISDLQYHRSQSPRSLLPANPIGAIAIFMTFAQVMATASLGVLTVYHGPLTWILVLFIVLFPSSVVIIFFYILMTKRHILYAPFDYQDERNFMVGIAERIVRVEMTQDELSRNQTLLNVLRRVILIDLRSTDENLDGIIKDLINLKDWEVIKYLAKGYLKVNRPEVCIKICQDMLIHVHNEPRIISKTKRLMAYSYIKLSEYRKSIDLLQEVYHEAAEPDRMGAIAIPLAFAYQKLAREKLAREQECQFWLSKAREAPDSRDFLSNNRLHYGELFNNLFGKKT